jgi:hypothetical protein
MSPEELYTTKLPLDNMAALEPLGHVPEDQTAVPEELYSTRLPSPCMTRK